MYSIEISGCPTGSIPGQKGLRQGDPLSPYLFVLCMEVLSILNNAARNGKIAYQPKCARVGLMHLFFVDDLLLFLEAIINYRQGIQEMLQEFYYRLRLKVNFSKSDVQLLC